TTPPQELHPFPTRRSSDLCATIKHRSKCWAPLQRAGIPSVDWAWVIKDTLTRTVLLHFLSSTLILNSVSQYAEPHEFVSMSGARSEEHTSELQSRGHLVCR